MDHLCHKCGNSVEDGKPFCSQCGAPQIRVAVPEPAALSVAGTAASNDLTVFPLAPPVVPGPLSVPSPSAGIQWPRAFRTCAVAALIGFLVTGLRLMVPPLAILGAGVLAVILYRRRNPNWRVDAGSGAQLGAISGLLFSAISAVFAALALALLQAGGPVRQGMLDAFQQLATRSNDPQVQAALELLKRPEGLASKMMDGLAVLLVFSIAAGCVAGALTGVLLSRKSRP